MATSHKAQSSTEPTLDIQRVHQETMRARMQMPTQASQSEASSLLGGQSPRDVLLTNHYTPQSVSVRHGKLPEESYENFEDFIMAAFSPEGALTEGESGMGKAGGAGRVVWVVGGCGMGKSTAVERLVWDWACGVWLQHFALVLRVGVRDLISRGDDASLQNVLLHSHPHLPAAALSAALLRPHTLLVVLDGVEQLHTPSSTLLCSNTLQPASGAVLLASLVQGVLLHGASLLVTSRQTDSRTLLGGLPSPHAWHVQLLGFSKAQRKAFFERIFGDESTASQAFEQGQRSVGAYDFCGCPVFCWTLGSVYKTLLLAGEALPETLTQLFSHITTSLLHNPNPDPNPNPAPGQSEGRVLLCGLGQLARHCALRTHYTCSVADLSTCGLQRFLTSPWLRAFLRVHGDVTSPDSTFSFLSPIMQEFLLAASFYLDQSERGSVEELLAELEGHSEGRWELMELFLAGLSELGQRGSLECALGEFGGAHVAEFRRWFGSFSEEALASFDKKRHLRCFRLLHQSQSPTLVRNSIRLSARLGLSYGGLGVPDSAALSYVLSCLGGAVVLNLYRSSLTEDHAHRLGPAFRLARKIILSQSSLSVGVVGILASALIDGSVAELDLSYTHLGDAGVHALCPGLKHSTLHTLQIPVCGLSEACCEDLALVLADSQLRVLDLRGNRLQDQGLVLLSTALKSSHCRLQHLSLGSCELTAASMEALSAALSSGHSTLESLDLTTNALTDRGMDHLSTALGEPGCRLHTLTLFDCELTGSCCAGIAAALRGGTKLSQLDLSCNELGQDGALTIINTLTTPECPLQKLSLVRCELTVEVFRELGSALGSATSRLTELSVGLNNGTMGDAAAKYLWDALRHTHCKLQHLDVEMLGLTDGCVEDLCGAVRVNGSLKTLILKNNELTDASVPPLVKLMQDSPTMQELNLQYNDFSEDVFDLMDTCSKIRY